MLALLIALSLSQVTPDSRVTRVERVPGGRMEGGRGGVKAWAFFEAFPLGGAGTSGACSTTPPTGAKGEALTFTRASVAECYSNDGQTLTQLSSNVPRVSSGRIDSTWMGVWSEGVMQQWLLYSRDWSQAAYAKTNVTCARNAAGMRGGDANGASTCTATASGGTVTQSIVATARPFVGSTHVKRGVGTGTIEITPDCSNWYDITARLSTTRWRRVVPTETPGCMGGDCIVVPQMQTLTANPCLGIRFGTSGDSVVLDFSQVEETLADYAASTPMESAGTAVLRQGDWMRTVLASDAFSPNSICMSAHVVGTFGRPSSTALYVTSDGPATYPTTQSAAIYAGSSNLRGTVACYFGSTAIGFVTTLDGFTHDSRTTCDFTPSGITGTTSATPIGVGSSSPSGTFNPAAKYLSIGSTPNANSNVEGVIKGAKFDFSGRCSHGAISNTASDFVWVGDSIIAGSASGPFSPPMALSGASGVKVWNAGVGSALTSDCVANYATYATRGLAGLIWTCGTNDISSGASGVTVAAAAQVPLAAARARGETVIVTGIIPCGGKAGWTAGLETQRVAYNTAMQTWAGLNGATYVSMETLGTGASPNPLTAANDSGDGLHLTKAGGLAAAALVDAVFP